MTSFGDRKKPESTPKRAASSILNRRVVNMIDMMKSVNHVKRKIDRETIKNPTWKMKLTANRATGDMVLFGKNTRWPWNRHIGEKKQIRPTVLLTLGFLVIDETEMEMDLLLCIEWVLDPPV